MFLFSRKRLAALVAASSAVAVMAAGGFSGSSQAATGHSASGVTIGFVQLFAEPYATQIAEGIEASAKPFGATVKVSGPSSLDPTTAIADFQNLASAGAKGILTMAFPEQLWRKPISVAGSQGIAVDTIDISSQGPGSSFHTGSPRQQMGAAVARYFATKLPSGAKGLIVSGICVPGLPQLTSPVAGFKTQMKKIDPGINVITVATGGSDAADFAAWQRIIAKYPTALGFFGACDQDLPALVKLKQQNPNSKWLNGVSSAGENPVGWSALEKGTLTAAVTQRGYVEGVVAGHLMLEDLVKHKAEPKGWIDTGFDLMTKSTVGVLSKALASPAASQAYYSGLIAKLETNPPTINPEDNQQNTFNVPTPTHNGSNVK